MALCCALRMNPVLILLALLVAVFPAVAGPSSSKLLTGRVSHSETLPPLPATLRPGQLFGTGAIPQRFAGQTRQFLIPDWLAGTWQRDSAQETSRIELPSGRKQKPGGHLTARVTDKFGTYADSQGLIWQVFDPARSLGNVDHGTTVDYHQVSDYDLSIEPDDTVLVRVRAVHTVVSKPTRRIVTTYQDEELNLYSRLADGQLKTDSSVKVFDLKGKPFLLTRAVSNERRVKPFRK